MWHVIHSYPSTIDKIGPNSSYGIITYGPYNSTKHFSHKSYSHTKQFQIFPILSKLVIPHLWQLWVLVYG